MSCFWNERQSVPIAGIARINHLLSNHDRRELMKSKLRGLLANDWNWSVGLGDNAGFSGFRDARWKRLNCDCLCRPILQREELDESHQFCTATASNRDGAADYSRDDRIERDPPIRSGLMVA